MKYSDLVSFAPIDTVVELRAADSLAAARGLVETFVISERLAGLLCEVVAPQLQLAGAGERRGLLVVGNYGTGKSHLMAVISAVAEHRELAARLTDPRVADRLARIAGTFKIVRVEIGATRMALRDILCGALVDGLAGFGVTFVFPSAAERHENKSALAAMMAAFQAVHPERGLLLVVDELLDYLRSRGEQELGLDLAFLRELGEVCRGTRFRVIAGVQDSLFEQPRFQAAADALRRVKDRFEAVRIAREDVAFVVAERLLKKDDRQQALVRAHLIKFCPLYGGMRERLEEFVRLFPVHPAYLTMVERVSLAERRDVLKMLSAEIRRISGDEVPADAPGLIAYDSYLAVLRDSPSYRAVPEVRAVLERSAVLAERVQEGVTRAQYRPVALRIVHALAVHRLTVDADAPVGLTAEQLRDDLCLSLPLPEREAGFLRTVIEAVLREVVRAVRGQYISFNGENGQYFLDLEKDVDFIALIERRGAEVEAGQLDRWYFEALQAALGVEAAPCVRGHRCWPFELVWAERGAGRDGYLCLGVPSERPTSVPAREFFLHFVQPFAAPGGVDVGRADELFVRLVGLEDDFVRALRLYAGARELAASASGGHKKIYESRASEHLRSVVDWLGEHPGAFEVGHLGRGRSLLAVVGETGGAFRETVMMAGSRVLASHFLARCPGYPRFEVVITRENRVQAAQEALRGICGSRSTLGAAVLRGLELMDGEVLRPLGSRFAREVLELLDHKGPGQVVNRGELVRGEVWGSAGIEVEFLVVVLAALVSNREVVLSVAGEMVDAGSLEKLVRLGVADAGESFECLQRPRGGSPGALQALCELLGVQSDAEIQRRTRALLDEVVTAQARIGELVVWGRPVVAEAVRLAWQVRLGGLKAFLEALLPFVAKDKLGGFPRGAEAVREQAEVLALLREVEGLVLRVRQVAPLAAYLGRAEVLLAASHPWQEQARAARTMLLGDGGRAALLRVQDAYRDAYLRAHARARFADEGMRAALAADPRVAWLQELAIIKMLPEEQLRGFLGRLAEVRVCRLVRADLEEDPMCPHCGFRPAEEEVELESMLESMMRGWTRRLLEGIALSGGGDSEEVRGFVASGRLPEEVSPGLVAGFERALRGVVVVRGEELRGALADGGACTLVELRERFERHVGEKIAGRDGAKVRVVIE